MSKLILDYAEYVLLCIMVICLIASIVSRQYWKAGYWLGGVILTTSAVFGIKN